MNIYLEALIVAVIGGIMIVFLPKMFEAITKVYSNEENKEEEENDEK